MSNLNRDFELIRRMKRLEGMGWTFEQDQNYVKIITPEKFEHIFGLSFLAGKTMEEACSFAEGFMTSLSMLNNRFKFIDVEL